MDSALNSWLVSRSASESSAKASSVHRRPLEPQLQQMNASFSAGMELQWQPKKTAFSIDGNKDRQQCS